MNKSLAMVLVTVAASSGAFPTSSSAQSERCLDMDCFNESRIRDFERINETTLVVYVGRERCAFMITVDNLFCDLTFLPDISFVNERIRRRESAIRTALGDDRGILGERYAGDPPGDVSRDRICKYNATEYALETFGLASAEVGDATFQPCEVRSIDVVTDDDLVQLLVDTGEMPPPPPIGNGEISRPARSDDNE